MEISVYVIKYAIEDREVIEEWGHPFIKYEVVIANNDMDGIEHIQNLYSDIWKLEQEMDKKTGNFHECGYTKSDLDVRKAEKYNTVHPYLTGTPVYSVEALKEYKETIEQELKEIDQMTQAYR